MNTQWRLLVAALRFVTHRSASRSTSPYEAPEAPPREALRLLPLAGIVLGVGGGAIYWLGSQLFPTSVAVILALFALSMLEFRAAGIGARFSIFIVLIQYNALMALSAAHVPMALPPYLTLGLIMVAGQAASRALVVSVMATDSLTGTASTHSRPTITDLTVALVIGFAPALLLGIPGLVGLVSAILIRLLLTAALLPRVDCARARLDIAQRLSEVSFNLGALATWKYI